MRDATSVVVEVGSVSAAGAAPAEPALSPASSAATAALLRLRRAEDRADLGELGELVEAVVRAVELDLPAVPGVPPDTAEKVAWAVLNAVADHLQGGAGAPPARSTAGAVQTTTSGTTPDTRTGEGVRSTSAALGV